MRPFMLKRMWLYLRLLFRLKPKPNRGKIDDLRIGNSYGDILDDRPYGRAIWGKRH